MLKELGLIYAMFFTGQSFLFRTSIAVWDPKTELHICEAHLKFESLVADGNACSE